MTIIDRLESDVRSYCRSFPTVFHRARGSELFDERGRAYLDFFAGAGALNYGHDNPHLRDRLIEYISEGGVAHALDMATRAKCAFLDAFERIVLLPRDLRYKVMFPGPTGTNAVEAALKLARKVTGRTNVVTFTNAFHGMTLGSLAITGNRAKRSGAGVPLANVTRMPFDGYLGDDTDTLDYIDKALRDPSSGVAPPAAIILETVQAEGGINVATESWLRGVRALARDIGALLIVDDIQVGCGRTGPFFSFEPARVRPDIVCLSKSLSGFGLPMAITLMRPELDVWDPGEHNGTFRGNNHAFVTATAALERYWRDEPGESPGQPIAGDVAAKASRITARLGGLAARWGARVRGRGMIQGLVFRDPATASKVSREAFSRGLVIETAGPKGEVLKLLPALTIPGEQLERGLDIVEASVRAVCERKSDARPIAWTSSAAQPAEASP